MSTYIYLTAEKKKKKKWVLFKSPEENSDWEGQLTPPLIIDGGWPNLTRKMIERNSNFVAPPDVSEAFNDFQMNVLKNEWSIGWAMYTDSKNISFEFGINNQIKLGALFKNRSVNKTNLRLIYWWG